MDAFIEPASGTTSLESKADRYDQDAAACRDRNKPTARRLRISAFCNWRRP